MSCVCNREHVHTYIYIYIYKSLCPVCVTEVRQSGMDESEITMAELIKTMNLDRHNMYW